jgi:transcriptional regulator with XRE-family HTH domain
MGMAELGLKLKRTREGLGLSQEEVAGRAKMAVRTLSRLESGDGNPTLLTLEALARALETSLGVFIGQPQQANAAPGPSFEDAQEALNAISRAKPIRRLVGLYILTRDDKYLERIQALLPPQSPLFQALRLIP